MKTNISGYGRILRIIVGLGGLYAAYYYKQPLWVEIVAAVVVLTGVIGWCGLYAIFGINKTAKKAAPKAAAKTAPKAKAKKAPAKKATAKKATKKKK